MNLQHYWDLVLVLTRKELKVRYKSSVLGYVWSIANPLAFALVFYVAFKVFMKVQMENYALFLIAGLFPWQWFSNSVGAAPMIFLSNGSIIKKIAFPRSVVVFTIVLQDMVHFVCSVPIVALFLFAYGMHPTWSWLYGLPILLVVQLALTYGVSLAVASINLFFRDMDNLTKILVQLLFFFMYSVDMIPVRYRTFVSLNPVALVMVNWRNLFLKGYLDLNYLLISVCFAAVVLFAGTAIYRRLSWRFAEVL